MALVYVPKGTKRKSKAHLSEIAEKYFTNGRYDQKKSDMIAVTHKSKVADRQKLQAKQRKDLIASAKIYASMEAIIAKTLVWEEPNAPAMVSPSPMQVAPVINNLNNLRTPGALIQTVMIGLGQKHASTPKRKPYPQRRKSSFATGTARL